MSTRWFRFKKTFTYTPRKSRGKPAPANAPTYVYEPGNVDSLNDEAAEKALAGGYAEEVEAPKTSEVAAKMKAGELEARSLRSPAPAASTSTAGGKAGEGGAPK